MAGGGRAGAPARTGTPAACSIFIRVLTAASLLLLGLQWLPLSPATLDLLRADDNAICAAFLIDFGRSLARALPQRSSVIGERVWLDVPGSLPTVPGFSAAGRRLAR
jgi:hypothetical protein